MRVGVWGEFLSASKYLRAVHKGEFRATRQNCTTVYILCTLYCYLRIVCTALQGRERRSQRLGFPITLASEKDLFKINVRGYFSRQGRPGVRWSAAVNILDKCPTSYRIRHYLGEYEREWVWAVQKVWNIKMVALINDLIIIWSTIIMSVIQGTRLHHFPIRLLNPPLATKYGCAFWRRGKGGPHSPL